MLALLTDAHISPRVAEQIRAKNPECSIVSLHRWRDGGHLNAEDGVILTAATEDGLTFVTYDQRTIAPLISQWMAEGRDHRGVVFIDDRTILQEDIGGQVLAILELLEDTKQENWVNTITYLRPPREP